ncbi:TPA: type II toxin-antitoxin system PemK/MazF family toxin [Staphylococcus pseudintermedius]
MEREVKNKKLLKATNNFEDICNSKNFKFKYLDDWLYTKSKILKKETHSNKQKEYRFYPRGTIVYAKLAVNIGSEFSGNHFCIVLNKNDHKRSELITVVPLTSKKLNFL